MLRTKESVKTPLKISARSRALVRERYAHDFMAFDYPPDTLPEGLLPA